MKKIDTPRLVPTGLSQYQNLEVVGFYVFFAQIYLMKVKFSISPDSGGYYLDESAFVSLRNFYPFTRMPAEKQADCVKITKGGLSWFVRYAEDVLKGKVFSDETIVEQLFVTGKLTKDRFKQFLRCYLAVTKDYAIHLAGQINEENISRYSHAIAELCIDLEWLISHVEWLVQGNVDKISLLSGRRADLSPTDIYSAARELFFIEQTEKTEQLYLRDLKPVVMFQIRQLLEIFGKDLVGYLDICDDKGNPVKKFSQIAWKFIAQECGKPDSRISLPFRVSSIQKINTWANSFVHTTYIYSSVIQYFALKYIAVIFKGSGKNIMTYDGKAKCKLDIADIKIESYQALKVDFENFLGKEKGYQVNWLRPERTGAYIISL